MNSKIKNNAKDLTHELEWFTKLLDTRMKLYFGKDCEYKDVLEVAPPKITNNSLYGNFIEYYQLNFVERVALVISLIPHIKPELLDIFFTTNLSYDRGYTEFGGLKGNNHGGFLPTGETLIFMLAGDNLENKFDIYHLFNADHFFAKHNILKLEPATEGEPFLSGSLKISRDVLDYFTTGTVHKPDFSINFPAKLISTQLNWNDLVLEERTLSQIEEIKTWMKHGRTLMKDWGMEKKLRPGYRCLFYGPPGTGKTMTACLLGKYIERDVYKIDLSMVVSKYIGETEKNLAKVFDQAETKEWILFFDEADALFGKRTNISDAHDKYANQEVSYLLQRIEDFDGAVILASNMKSNLDDSFTRRFESIISFPMPKPAERLRLWQNGFSKASTLEDKIKLKQIAGKYELSGGAIINIIRFSSLMTLNRDSNVITLNDLEEGIKKEYHKEGRTL